MSQGLISIRATESPAGAGASNLTRRENAAPAPRHRPTQTPAEGIAESARPGQKILEEHWPTLAAAMGRYEQNVAETFVEEAHACVTAGLIRYEDRRRLAQRAETLGIRAFDAQLLIACAIRKWSLQRTYNAAPNREAPQLSFEYRSWRKAWIRFAILTGLAVTLDWIVLWNWLR